MPFSSQREIGSISLQDRSEPLKLKPTGSATSGITLSKFNKHILEGTSLLWATPEIAKRERIIRFFAREGRTRRRMLAEALKGAVEKAGGNLRMTRVVHPSHFRGTRTIAC